MRLLLRRQTSHVSAPRIIGFQKCALVEIGTTFPSVAASPRGKSPASAAAALSLPKDLRSATAPRQRHPQRATGPLSLALPYRPRHALTPLALFSGSPRRGRLMINAAHVESSSRGQTVTTSRAPRTRNPICSSFFFLAC